MRCVRLLAHPAAELCPSPVRARSNATRSRSALPIYVSPRARCVGDRSQLCPAAPAPMTVPPPPLPPPLPLAAATPPLVLAAAAPPLIVERAAAGAGSPPPKMLLQVESAPWSC